MTNTPSDKIKVLFVCTGNACRSQLAHGLLQAAQGARFEVHSAGLFPIGVDPVVVRVLREIDIDIAHHASQAVQNFTGDCFDLIVTMSQAAHDYLPNIQATSRMHCEFTDPFGQTPEVTRTVRDEIKRWLNTEFEHHVKQVFTT